MPWRQKLSVPLLAIILLSLLAAPAAGLAAPLSGSYGSVSPLTASGSGPVYRPGHILVKLKSSSASSSLQSLASAYGLRSEPVVPKTGVARFAVDAGSEREKIQVLRDNPSVEFAEMDSRVQAEELPNDPGYQQEWFLQAVRAPEAWAETTGAETITIAVVDTGVDLAHPDLKDKIVSPVNIISPPGTAQDDHGHGTQVAGVAAASSNNRLGIAAISWGAKIMPVKVLDASGSGWISDLAEGIVYAVDHGARIINLSLAGPSPSETLRQAIDYAHSQGCLVVAAAGNENSGTDYYPAAADHVIGVVATDGADRVADFSNHGPYVDLAAPGVSIYSTARGGQYAYGNGTSTAAPLVAGVAALVWTLHPNDTNDQIERRLEETATDLGQSGRDNFYGYGLIDAARAVGSAPPQQSIRPGRTYLPLIMDDAYGGWTTGINVGNLNPSPVHLNLEFYDLAGHLVGAETASIPARGYWSSYQGGRFGSGFAGSAVISSDHPPAVVVNEVHSSGKAMSYPGLTQPSQQIFLPVILDDAYGGWTTGVNVTNPNDQAANVIIWYYNSAGQPVFSDSQSLGPHASWGRYQGGLLGRGFAGSAMVSSDHPVLAVVNEVPLSGNSISYPGGEAGATSLRFPVIVNGAGGWTSGLNLQNVGLRQTEVIVSFLDAEGRRVAGETRAVAGRAKWDLYQGSGMLPAGFSGSAAVTSGEPLAAVANLTREGGAAAGYTGIQVGAANLYAPVVLSDAYGGWTTQISLENVGALPTRVHVSYYGPQGEALTSLDRLYTLPANGLLSIDQASANLPPGFAGTATIEADQPLVAVVQEKSATQFSTAYVAFPQ